MKTPLIRIFLPALLLLIGCGRPPSVVELPSVSRELVLAQVNTVSVTESVFRQAWDKQPPTSDSAETRTAVLDSVIERIILLERARALGLADDPIVRETFESALIARFKEIELQGRIAAIEISEAELQAAYDALATTRFTVGPQIRMAVLWFNTRGQVALTDRYRPRLEALRTTAGEIPTTEGFGQLAISNSEHRASRYQGGIIDWLEVDEPYTDPWRQAILELATPLQAPGDLSEIASNEKGLFLLRLVERREATQRSFEHVRASLRKQLIRDQRQAVEGAFRTENHKLAAVMRFDERLSEIKALPVDSREQPKQSTMFALEVEK